MHYSLAQKPDLLKAWAEVEAQEIKNLNLEDPVLVYCGMSGISAATALSIALYEKGQSHNMIYIRKEHEKSHGESIECEGFYYTENAQFLFVDDFVCSGATREYCLDILNKHRKVIGFCDVEFTGCIFQK